MHLSSCFTCTGHPCNQLFIIIRNTIYFCALSVQIILCKLFCATPHHTVRSAYQPHWTNEFRTVANKNESTYTLTHSYFSSLNLPFLAPTFPASPPWLNKDVDIDISLKESVSKKNGNPELLRLMSLDHINRYNTHHTHIYTLMVLRLKI